MFMTFQVSQAVTGLVTPLSASNGTAKFGVATVQQQLGMQILKCNTFQTAQDLQNVMCCSPFLSSLCIS